MVAVQLPCLPMSGTIAKYMVYSAMPTYCWNYGHLIDLWYSSAVDMPTSVAGTISIYVVYGSTAVTMSTYGWNYSNVSGL